MGVEIGDEFLKQVEQVCLLVLNKQAVSLYLGLMISTHQDITLRPGQMRGLKRKMASSPGDIRDPIEVTNILDAFSGKSEKETSALAKLYIKGNFFNFLLALSYFFGLLQGGWTVTGDFDTRSPCSLAMTRTLPHNTNLAVI